MDVGAEVRSRRALVMVAVRDYPGAPETFTSGIDDQLRIVESWWCDPSLGDRAFNPHQVVPLSTRRDVEDALYSTGLRTLGPSDVAMVYVTGHGRRGASGRHYLLLPDTAHDRLTATGYPTSDLVTAVLDSHAEHVLVIIDSCCSGTLIAELAQLRENFSPSRRDLTSLNVFTIGDFDEKPRVREFTELLTQLDKQWWTKAGYADPFLTVDEFEYELSKVAKSAQLLRPHWAWRAGPSTTPSLCLPNPAYQQPDDLIAASRRQVADTTNDLDFWLDRASGRTSADDPGWYFTGRRELTTAVADFLQRSDGVLLVTGAAGTGKSAVIARAVTLSDPGFRADPRYQQTVSGAPVETVPPIGSVDVAVLARNKDVDDIAIQILIGLGATPQVAAAGQTRIEVLREQLRGQLLADGRRRTLVLDGLDEARRPSLVVADLLGPLARLADDRGRRPIRLMVGVRSTDPGNGADDGGHELLDLLRRSVAPRQLTEVRTDGSRVQADIAAYVEVLLTDSPYGGDDVRGNVGTLVARRVTPSFLDARIAGCQLRAAEGPALLDDDLWLCSLDEGTVGLLRSDLRDAATTQYPAAELLAVLQASAYSQGAGIPWADIWPAVAAAVLDRPLPDADGAIAEVLCGRLSGYLARDAADGRVVYRPAHALLAQGLRREPSRILEASTVTTSEVTSAETEVHRRITNRLSQLLSADYSAAPHPYLRRHLVEHARRGEILDDAHVPMKFLPWESSGRVRGALGLPIVDDPRHRVLGTWARIEPFLGNADPESRALSMSFALLATGAILTTDLTASGASLRSRWARWSLAANVLAHVGSPVSAVAVVPGPDGRVLLAIGSDDATVRLWDPVTGSLVGDPLIGHTGPVLAVAAVAGPHGRALLASGSRDCTARLWDPTTGARVGDPLIGHTDWVAAVAAVPRPDGHTLLATGSYDATVQLWDPTTGTRVGDPLTGHTSGVTAVAAMTEPDGQTLLATGSYDATVQLWDPATGARVGDALTAHTGPVWAVAVAPRPHRRPLLASGGGTVRLWEPTIGISMSEPLAGHTGWVRAIAALPGPDGRMLLATGSEDSTVRLWDPATGATTGDYPLTGHTGGVLTVAALPGPDGRMLLATGSRDGTVRVWDPATKPPGAPFNGHTSAVWAVTALSGPDGRVLLATASEDGMVRLWDRATGAPTGSPLSGHTGPVFAVAALPGHDGHMLLATGGSDRTLRLWDLAAGTPIGDPLTGHTGPVFAVAALPGPNGRTLLATGSRDGTVRLWDPITGTQVGDPLTGHTDWVTALTPVLGPDGCVLLATASSDHTLRLWDPATGTPIGGPLTGHTDWVFALAAVPDPDGHMLLATGSKDGTVRVWDPATGTQVGDPLTGHTGTVWAVGMVPGHDGHALLVTGSHDTTVRLWDPATGDELVRLTTGAPVFAVCAEEPEPAEGIFLSIGGAAGVAVVEVHQPLAGPTP